MSHLPNDIHRRVGLADRCDCLNECGGDSRVTSAAVDVLQERKRQTDIEGWTSEHDDTHAGGELSTAAACYAMQAAGELHHPNGAWRPQLNQAAHQLWPWARRSWKPAPVRRMLVKAGALILAEIERIDRAEGTMP